MRHYDPLVTGLLTAARNPHRGLCVVYIGTALKIGSVEPLKNGSVEPPGSCEAHGGVQTQDRNSLT